MVRPHRLRRRGHRPRLPRPAVAVRPISSPRFNGEPVPPSPPLGVVADADGRPRRLAGRAPRRGQLAMRDFRKHTSWYLTGYPVGGEVRRRFSHGRHAGRARRPARRRSTRRSAVVPGGERIRRGHTNGPIRVALPAGYLDDLDDATLPDDGRRDGAQRRLSRTGASRPRVRLAAPARAARAARPRRSTIAPPTSTRRRAPARIRVAYVRRLAVEKASAVVATVRRRRDWSSPPTRRSTSTAAILGKPADADDAGGCSRLLAGGRTGCTPASPCASRRRDGGRGRARRW